MNVKHGDTCYLWHDLWAGNVKSQIMPQLLSIARNKSISIHKSRDIVHLSSIFHLPLSAEAYVQLIDLAQLFEDHPDSEEKDTWTSGHTFGYRPGFHLQKLTNA
jgi:hypothetical protein